MIRVAVADLQQAGVRMIDGPQVAPGPAAWKCQCCATVATAEVARDHRLGIRDAAGEVVSNPVN